MVEQSNPFYQSWYLLWTALIATAAVALLCFLDSGPAKAQAAPTASGQAETGTVAPGTPVTGTFSAAPPPPPPMTAGQRRDFEARFSRRPRGGPTNLPHAPMKTESPSPGPPAQPSKALGPQAAAAPTDFLLSDVIFKATGAQFSGVGEPSGEAVNQTRFQTGNWYAGASTDGGATFQFLDPSTMFGSGFCCDQVVLYDQYRNTWFWLLQYLDHLVLANSRDLVNWCSYTWKPQNLGIAAGEIDYNDLALTRNYIYIASNYFTATNGGSFVARLPLAPQVSCTGFSYNFFTHADLGLTFKPVSGANDIMYWGTNWFGTLGSSFRIFKWPETTTTVSWFDRTLSTTFAFMTRSGGQNCGSADGVVKNWCQFADSRVLGGARYFDSRTSTLQLVFSFNANQGGPFNLPFPYTERVRFRETDLAYLGSDRLFSYEGAWQFMSLATNGRGAIGMTTLFGGGANSTHTFPSGAVFLNDDVAPVQPWQGFFNAVGAGNPCLNMGTLYRSGDYLTTRAYHPNNLAFLGFDFVMTADAGACGASLTVVQPHEAIFGRARDF